MRVILKSGYVIDNVETIDSTRNPIGLWIWSTKQAADQLLNFKNVTIRSSEIAAIEGIEHTHSNIEENLPWNGAGFNDN